VRQSSVIAGIVGLLLTAGWLGACAYYVEIYVGWSGVLRLLPHELAMGVAGVCLPPTLLWLALVYFLRGQLVTEEVQKLLRHFEAMTYPDDAAKTRVQQIGETLKAQADALGEASDEIFERMDAMRHAFKAQTSELAGASVRAASQAQNLREALSAQTEQVEAASNRMNGLMKASRESVDGQLKALDEAAGRIDSMVHGVTDALKQPVADLQSVADRTVAATEEVAAHLARRSEELAAAQAGVQASGDALHEDLDRDLKALVDAGETVFSQAGHFNEMIRQQVEQLGQVIGDTETRVISIRGALAEERDHFGALTTDLTETSRKVGDSLKVDARDVRNSFELAATRVKLITEILREQGGILHAETDQVIDRLRDAAAGAASEIAQAGAQQVDRLAEGAMIARESFREVRSEIEPMVMAIETAGARAVEQAGEISRLLGSHSESLGMHAERVSERVDRIAETLRRGTENFDDAAHNAVAQSAKVVEIFRSQGRVLTLAAENATTSAGDLRAAVREEVTAFGELSGDFKTLLQDVKDTLSQQAEAITAASASARTTSGDIREQLRTQTEEVKRVAETNLNSLTGMAETIDAIAVKVRTAADRAISRAEDLGGNLEAQANDFGSTVELAFQQARDAGQIFKDQGKDLLAAADEAAMQARTLKEKALEASRDVFLRTATVMMEDLNSTAIDLDKIIEEDLPAEYWKRYRSGDKSIFARRLLRKPDRFVSPEVKARYDSDERFRDQVTRYLNQFDSLIKQSADCDPEHILSAAFMTSDVGKLYLLLARTLGRKS